MDYLFGLYDYFYKVKNADLDKFKKPDGYKNINTSKTLNDTKKK